MWEKLGALNNEFKNIKEHKKAGHEQLKMSFIYKLTGKLYKKKEKKNG